MTENIEVSYEFFFSNFKPFVQHSQSKSKLRKQLTVLLTLSSSEIFFFKNILNIKYFSGAFRKFKL